METNIFNCLETIEIKQISQDFIYKILNDIRAEIKDNEKELKTANKIDLKYFDIKLDIDKLLSIINEYKKFKISRYFKETNVFVSLNGNIYITLELCLLAILTSTRIFIDINDCMLGTNKTIIYIINKVLEDYKITHLINFCNKTDIEEIRAYIDKLDKVIFIDNINEFEYYQRKEINKVVYYPIFSIDIFCDDDNLEELQKTTYQYAQENGFDIEIYSDLNKKEVVKTINQYSKFRNVLVLTNSEETKKLFKSEIKDKKLYINENPFKNKEMVSISKDIFSE